MLVILGFLVVLFSVFGGFAMQGGHLAALFQPLELLMIGGAALGTFFVGNDAKAIRATFAALPTLFHSSQYTKARYMELMGLMYEILSKIRKEGLMSVEDDIDDPYRSAIFVKYPYTLGDEHILEFITDYLRRNAYSGPAPVTLADLYAYYPSRHQLPAKVRAFINFLGQQLQPEAATAAESG